MQPETRYKFRKFCENRYGLLRFEIFTRTNFYNPQNPPKSRVNKHFQTRIILKLTCLGRGSSDFYEIWHTGVAYLSQPALVLILL